MEAVTSPARPLLLALALTWFVLSGTPAPAELPTAEERLKILADLESVKSQAEKEKTRPPLEFFRSQVAPFGILPYVKPNHWSTLSLELRANYDDYAGLLQTAPVALLGMPQEVLYRRDARLMRGQHARIGLQMMLPQVPRELTLELLRPEAIRADETWQTSLRMLEPHQMLILFLTRESNDAFASWNRLQAMYPTGTDRTDVQAVEHRRYYRLVLPLEPDQPLLSAHPLTWTIISHVIWDGRSPETLNPGQQQAMLDWLHWGGQLILVGGAGPSFHAIRDSFLTPYLPAEPSGENLLLTRDDLTPLAEAYRPPATPRDWEDPRPVPTTGDEIAARVRPVNRYRAAEPIVPASNRPVFLAGLRPVAGASVIPLGESSDRVLGVERRVGRGRILMLALSPNDPAIAAWPGLDTLVRRVVLRRPEDPMNSAGGWQPDGRGLMMPSDGALSGRDLSWFRYLSRDMGAPDSRPSPYNHPEVAVSVATPSNDNWAPQDTGDDPPQLSPGSPVAEWLDSAALPRMSRDALEDASGLKVPGASFVLKVIVAYLIALGPLNWLICRFVFGRREWAWVVIPLLSLGFAIGVERAAAYDVGYDSACDEIDLVETFAGYPRAHVSRFASLYSTGRLRFTISYPNDPTALALPMDRGRSLAGEDLTTSIFRSYPTPALEGFQVQPRSLSMFRAEQMVSIGGTVALASDEGPRRVVNTTDLELRDAVLVDVNGPGDRRETYLGTITPGASVEVEEASAPPLDSKALPKGTLDPSRLLRELRGFAEGRPEEKGEVRLVAWSPRPFGGQTLEPSVDRQRGLALVVVHLRFGPPPAPDGPRYHALALGPEVGPSTFRRPIPEREPERARVLMEGMRADRAMYRRGGRRHVPVPPLSVSPSVATSP
ncbi:MAG: hypothetical protein JO034_23255 [Singulisphaera sp.]|nr:hypothetical protein [Singulisphaera sp.]